MEEIIAASKVPVNFGKLLENQLKKWQGGNHHPRGIAEYVSNSDDSYRRLKKFSDQDIIVNIYSRTGKKIEKLIIKDFAEGMSYDELENKFFQYFENFSGREKGERVTGRFGTGGKAYAIMNFRHCWITSVQNGKECKAWFKWAANTKEIIKGYNNGGYKNKASDEPNGTTIILESSIKVNHQLQDFVLHLEKQPRIRHILKNQRIFFNINRKKKIEKIELKYLELDESQAKKIWQFPLPESLRNENGFDNELTLRYFEKPLGGDAFIDLTDGISSIADLVISNFDSRPFSKYINGNLVITKLVDSHAVKENRRGLEEGDDLTEEIEEYVQKCIIEVVNEVEELQKQIDKQKRINAANEKLNELSKFLSKQDLKFKLELKELKKRFSKVDDFPTTDKGEHESSEIEKQLIYRKPYPDDPKELLIKGRWIIKTGEGRNGTDSPHGIPEFIPEEDGEDFAVKIGYRRKITSQERNKKQGLQVLMSNDPNNPNSPTFTQYDDPVSDRDLESNGIIWINAIHPIIVKYGEDTKNDVARNENIVNYTLMIIAQYYAQKESELQPEDERDDPLLLFRKHFFKLQMEIREDNEISYFEDSK